MTPADVGNNDAVVSAAMIRTDHHRRACVIGRTLDTYASLSRPAQSP